MAFCKPMVQKPHLFIAIFMLQDFVQAIQMQDGVFGQVEAGV